MSQRLLRSCIGIEVVEYAATTDTVAVNIGLKAQAAGVRTVKVTADDGDIIATNATVDLTLIAGTATDVKGGSGTDTITGGTGVNVIYTSEGDDVFTGGEGADNINVDGTKAQTSPSMTLVMTPISSISITPKQLLTQQLQRQLASHLAPSTWWLVPL